MENTNEKLTWSVENLMKHREGYGLPFLRDEKGTAIDGWREAVQKDFGVVEFSSEQNAVLSAIWADANSMEEDN